MMSPLVRGRQEDCGASRTARSRLDRTGESALVTTRSKVRKVGVEFGLWRVAAVVKGRLGLGLAQIRRCYLFKEKHSHQCTDVQSTHFESQLSYHAKQSSLALSDMLALTQCPNCKHIGVSLLTTSTKEQLSPKFMLKVRNLLPSNSDCPSARREAKTPSLLFAQEMKDSAMQASSLTINKDDAPPKESKDTHELSIVMYEDAQIPDISEIHMNPSSQSLSMDSSPLDSPREHEKTDNPKKSPDFNQPAESKRNEISFELIKEWKKGDSNLTDIPKDDFSCSKPAVPRLNFSELTAGGKQPIKVFDRKKLSAGKITHFLREKRTSSVDSNLCGGVDRVTNVYKVRLQRAFDMVFLSRANKVLAELSLTFDFFSQEEEGSFLAGTFGSQAGLFVSPAAVTLLQGKLDKATLRRKQQAWVRLCP